MIKIICSGKIKEKYLMELIEDYKLRIGKYHKISIIEIKDENDLSKEALNILKNVENNEYVVACAINGEELTSVEFADFIDKTFLHYSCIDFIIGSSTGLDKSVYDRANKLVSFSRFTMPHGLFRGVLLEQIYRTFKINNNETYHK